MTPTEMKVAAIAAAIRGQDQPLTLARFCALLAMLTSANKEEREQAKREVRKLVATGAELLQAAQDAADLASFANRHEP